MIALRRVLRDAADGISRTASKLPFGVAAAWPGAFATLALLMAFSNAPAHAGQQPATDASTHLRDVETLVQQGHLEEAKAAMLNELAQRPNSVDGLNLLGIIESDLNDSSNALASFEKALGIAPNSTRTHNNLGSFYVWQKKSDLAEKEFRICLHLDPANRDANYNLGLLLMARGAPAEAIPHFERVHPANSAARFNLIRANLQAKRISEALRLAAALSKNNKDDVQVHFSLGVLLASEKEYKPALLELQQADLLRPDSFEIHFNLGQVELLVGENASAELALSRALKLKPDSAQALYLLAQTCANQSRPRDALDLLVRAHKIDPGDTDIVYLLAKVSMSQSFYEDAIPLLEAGLQLAPQRADLIAALGQSYFMAGKAERSIDEFKRLIHVDNSALSYAYLGIVYRNLGRFDEARETLGQGLALDAHNSSCLLNLALIAEQRGENADAEAKLQQVLHDNPESPEALLELANLRIQAKRLPEAESLLRRYVRVGRNPSTGYYKLGMVERSLHETAAADRDLSVFQTLSKNVSTGPRHYEHLFDYIDSRSQLAQQSRVQLDIDELIDHIQKNPGRPDDLYMLAETYLRSGKVAEARSTIDQLDKLSPGDFKTLTGVGVLLASYRLYDEAIQHFQAALQVNPESDEEEFDLANAYFRKGLYSDAFDTAGKISPQGRSDEAYLSLLGDIYAHLGQADRASDIFRDAIRRNPDNDQDYLALALLQLRENDVATAKQTLLKGQARIPASGKLLWGLGVVSILEGNTAEAAGQLERAVELLPEWPGSYSLLGVFYFQSGQVAKAREVLERFRNISTTGGIDVGRIEQVLAQAPTASPAGNEQMPTTSRKQLLALALSLADKTL